MHLSLVLNLCFMKIASGVTIIAHINCERARVAKTLHGFAVFVSIVYGASNFPSVKWTSIMFNARNLNLAGARI